MSEKENIKIVYEKVESKPPPRGEGGAWGWIKENLFSSKTSIFLTVIAAVLVINIAAPLLEWSILDATWTGEKQSDCDRKGACWIFIGEKFYQFIYGFYPRAIVWRVNLTFIVFPLLLIPFFIKTLPFRFISLSNIKRERAEIPFKFKFFWFLFVFFVFPILGFFFLQGNPYDPCVRLAEKGMCFVPTHKWGGLMITLGLTFLGIILSFPLGVLAGLGRSSNLKLIHYLSVVYIEFWRGVPLITILFMASVALPLFLPPGMEFDKLLRAIFGIVFFQSAYVAEVLRGGLQSIPRGQYEAADALGLNYVKKMTYIVLPQAFKVVLPSFVGISISLMQDTTLILILGLFDMLGMVSATTADPNWLGFEAEGLVFVGVASWTVCYAMSRYSFYLEEKTKAGN